MSNFITNGEIRIESERLCDENERLQAENAKLRDALRALVVGTNAELCADRDYLSCKGCSMHRDRESCTITDAMELLG